MKRTTLTTMSCSPTTVAVNSTTTCSVEVKDTAAGTASNPTGTVAFFFFQAEAGIRGGRVTGVQTCALPISKALSSDISVCAVTYKPTAIGTGSHKVTGDY